MLGTRVVARILLAREEVRKKPHTPGRRSKSRSRVAQLWPPAASTGRAIEISSAYHVETGTGVDWAGVWACGAGARRSVGFGHPPSLTGGKRGGGWDLGRFLGRTPREARSSENVN